MKKQENLKLKRFLYASIILSCIMTMGFAFWAAANDEVKSVSSIELARATEIPNVPEIDIEFKAETAMPISYIVEDDAPEVVKFVFPLQGEIMKVFSGDKLVFNQTTQDWRTHDGIDIEAAVNSPVYLIGDGIVENIIENNINNFTIEFSHADGINSIYYGISDFKFEEGDTVSQYDIIGWVGKTGFESGKSHLHFEMTKKGELINPLDILQ